MCDDVERAHPLSCYFGDVGCRRGGPDKSMHGWAWDPRVLRGNLGCKVSDRSAPAEVVGINATLQTQLSEAQIYDGGMELLFSSLTAKFRSLAEAAALEVIPHLVNSYLHRVPIAG